MAKHFNWHVSAYYVRGPITKGRPPRVVAKEVRKPTRDLLNIPNTHQRDVVPNIGQSGFYGFP